MMNKYIETKMSRASGTSAVWAGILVSTLMCLTGTSVYADGLASDYDSLPPLISTSTANDKPNVLLMLDTSGSMDNDSDDDYVGPNHYTSRTIMSRQAIGTLLNNFAETVNMGLMAFEPPPDFKYSRKGSSPTQYWEAQDLNCCNNYRINRGYLYIPIGSVDPNDTDSSTTARRQEFYDRLGLNIVNQSTPYSGYYNLFQFSNSSYTSSTDYTNKRLVSNGGTPIAGTYLSALEYRNGTLASGHRLSSISSSDAVWPSTNVCDNSDYAILITDGLPSVNIAGKAGNDLLDDFMPEVLAQAAALRDAGVTTYVIGFALPGGPEYLNSMAVSGGTDQAYFAENLTELTGVLDAIFTDIINKTSSGTGAAVVANRGNGLSADFQALYTPEKAYNGRTVRWVGTLHGFFIDENRLLREDTNGDGLLGAYNVDRILEFNYDDDAKVTYVDRMLSSSATDPTQIIAGQTITSEIEDIAAIWNARDQLAAVSDVLTQRTYAASANTGRAIFTSVDGETLLPFVTVNVSDLEDEETREETARDNIEDLEGQLYGTPPDTSNADLTNLEGLLDSLSTTIALTGDVDGVDDGDLIDAINDLLAQIESDRSDVNADITTEEGNLATALTNEATELGDLTQAQSDLATEESQRDTAQTALDQATTDKANADQAVTDAESALTTAESERDTAQGELTDAQAAQTTAQSERNTAASDVTAAETAVSDAEGIVTTETGDRDAANTALTQAQTDLGTAQGDLTTAQTALSDAQTAAATEKGQSDAALEDRDDAQTVVNNAQDAVDDAQTDVGNAQTAVNNAQSDVDDAQQDYDDALALAGGDTDDPNVVAAQSALDTAQGDLSTAQTNLGTAQGDLTSAQTALSTAQSDYNTADGIYQTQYDEWQDAEDVVTDRQSDVATAQGDVTTATGIRDDAQTAYNEAAADLATAEGNLTTAQDDLADKREILEDKDEALATANTDVNTKQATLTEKQTAVTDATTARNEALDHQTDMAEALATATTNRNDAQADVDAQELVVADAQADYDAAVAAREAVDDELEYLNDLLADLTATETWANDVLTAAENLRALVTALNSLNTADSATRTELLQAITDRYDELQALLNDRPTVSVDLAALEAEILDLLAQILYTQTILDDKTAGVDSDDVEYDDSIAESVAVIDDKYDQLEYWQGQLVGADTYIDDVDYIRYMDDNITGQAGDVDLTYDQRNDIITWTRGQDVSGLRNRTIDFDQDSVEEVWRLPDIVHSTPAVVGRPSELYYSRYGDDTYRDYIAAKFNRRQVVYAGSNGGMLHAFNAGFWDDSQKGYVTQLSGDTATAHPLGSELWSFIPKAALPHLQFVANTGYSHMALMDGAPQAFDVNIFPNDAEHPNGWGTILVVTMRMGGGAFTVRIDEDEDGTDEDVVVRPSVLIFDVTNPEVEPTLLAELSDPNMGFTLSKPALIKYREASSTGSWSSPANNRWLLVFGSGPTDLDTATSNQQARLYAYDLNDKEWASDWSNTAKVVTLENNAFIGDLSTEDWDRDYLDDVVYFGVNSGNAAAADGRLARLRLRSDQGASSWLGSATVGTFTDIERTIIGAPLPKSDVYGRRWVYFGTGRMLVAADNSSNQQEYFAGIREPIDTDYELTFNSVSSNTLLDISDIDVFSDETIDNGPSGVDNAPELIAYINEHNEGWIRELTDNGTDPSGRSDTRPISYLNTITFAEYIPSDDVCSPEGQSRVWTVDYVTGVASVDNYLDYETDSGTGLTKILPSLDVGAGKVGDISNLPDGNLVMHDSTGRVIIVEPYQSTVSLRRQSWRQIFNIDF